MRTMIKEEEDLLVKKQGGRYRKGRREERRGSKGVIYLDKQRKENIVVNKIDKHFCYGVKIFMEKITKIDK